MLWSMGSIQKHDFTLIICIVPIKSIFSRLIQAFKKAEKHALFEQLKQEFTTKQWRKVEIRESHTVHFDNWVVHLDLIEGLHLSPDTKRGESFVLFASQALVFGEREIRSSQNWKVYKFVVSYGNWKVGGWIGNWEMRVSDDKNVVFLDQIERASPRRVNNCSVGLYLRGETLPSFFPVWLELISHLLHVHSFSNICISCPTIFIISSKCTQIHGLHCFCIT